MILGRIMANDDQFHDTLLGKGGPLDQEESMEEAEGNDAASGVPMDDAATAAAMEEEAIPVANKLCLEIGLDAAVRHRKKGSAKLKAAAELAAAVAAAEERGYQNFLAEAKTAANQHPTFQRPAFQRPAFQHPANQRPAFQRPAFQHPANQRPAFQRPAFQRPANEAKRVHQVDNGVHKPNRKQWACNYCGFLNFAFRIECFNSDCQAPQARNTSNAGCYNNNNNNNNNNKDKDKDKDNDKNSNNQSELDKMTNFMLVLSS